MTKKTDRIICVRISFLYFFRQFFTLNKTKRIFYFDLYSKSHTLLIWIGIYLFGREKTAQILIRFFKVFGLCLKTIPHACAVPDYHWLNIKAHKQACDLTEAWSKNNFSEKSYHLFPQSAFDRECHLSLRYKAVCDHLWHIVENVFVLQALGFSNIILQLPCHYLPLPILQQFSHATGISYHYESDRARFLYFPFLILTLLFFIAQKSIRLFLPKPKQNVTPDIAVELAGIDCLEQQPTHANYIHPENCAMVYYVRSERKKYCKNVKSLTDFPIQLMHQLPINWGDLRVIFASCFILLRDYLRGGLCLQLIKQRLNYFTLYLDLSAFFRFYPVKVHLYNTFVNAKQIAPRLDAGLVTGVCRRFAISSVSYQTRVNYLDSYYFYYDVFDVYCTWGKAWTALIEGKSYIRHFQLIGNVYASQIFNVEPAKKLDTIVLFNSDMETHFPQHHTLSYNITFIKIVLSALDKLPHKPARVFLKAKNREEANRLLLNSELTTWQTQLGISITMLDNRAHDIHSAIALADAVISIGFTTPGCCALSAGKKSLYVTPYAFPYNDVFTPDRPFIAHDAENLKNLLLSKSSRVNTSLVNMDAFCDGKAAKRLYELCMEIVNGTNHAYP